MENSFVSLPIELAFNLVYDSIRQLLPNVISSYNGYPDKEIYYALKVDPFYECKTSSMDPRFLESLFAKIDLALEQNRPEALMLRVFHTQPANFSLFLFRKELTIWYINIYNLLAQEKEKELSTHPFPFQRTLTRNTIATNNIATTATNNIANTCIIFV